MKYDNFTAGVEPGGMRKIYEVKILICFLMDIANRSLSKTQINDIFQIKGLVNYFTFAQAFNELVKDKSIKAADESETDESSYVLTKQGFKTVEIFKDTIAITIKEKIDLSFQEYFENVKLKRDNLVKIKKVEDGYIVQCRMKDIGSDLMMLEIFAPDKEIVEKIKSNFMKDSLTLYQNTVDFLIRD